MKTAQEEQYRIVRYIRREAYRLHRIGSEGKDEQSLKIAESFFLLAQKICGLGKRSKGSCGHRWGPWKPATEFPVAITGCLQQKSICRSCDQERFRQFELD